MWDSPAEETSETFVRLWAEAVVRQANRVVAMRARDARDWRAAERGEEWSPQDEDLAANFRELWSEEHMLVWAAYQVERWSQRLAKERGVDPPPANTTLADLRNALEHLDDADLDETYAYAGDNPRNRSLRKLPGKRIMIGTSGRLLFSLIDGEVVVREALKIVNDIEDRFVSDLMEQQASLAQDPDYWYDDKEDDE